MIGAPRGLTRYPTRTRSEWGYKVGGEIGQGGGGKKVYPPPFSPPPYPPTPPPPPSVDPTRLLLTFNVSVNLGDKYHKNTALHWAVLAGNTTVISLLLDANSNVDAQNIKVCVCVSV